MPSRRQYGFSVVLLVALAACSGTRNQNIHGLGTGERDAADDAAPLPDAEEEQEEEPAPGPNDAGAEAAQAAADSGMSPLDARASDVDAQREDAQTALDGSTPDAALQDAETALDAGSAQDSASPEAGFAGVRLRVTRGGVPQPNLYVVWHGDGGGVLAVADTDVAGRVESALAVQSVSITLPKYDDSTSIDLFTYTDVKPGDDLQLDLAPRAQPDNSYLLTLDQPVADTQQYDVYGGPEGCGWGNGPPGAAIGVRNVATGFAPSNNALVVGAWATGHSAVLGYALVDGLRGPGPNESEIPAAVGMFSPPRNVTQALHNVPGLMSERSVELTLYATLRDQWLRVGLPEYFFTDAERAIAVPSFGFDGFVSLASWTHDERTVRSHFRVRGAGSVAPQPLELGRRLPTITAFGTGQESGAWRVYWTSDPAVERDAYLFEVHYAVTDMSGGTQANGTWSGLVSPALGAVQLPQLPPALLAVPNGGTVYLEVRRLSAVRSSLVQGYDAYRQESLRFYDNSAGDLTTPRLDVVGETEVVTWDFTD